MTVLLCPKKIRAGHETTDCADSVTASEMVAINKWVLRFIVKNIPTLPNRNSALQYSDYQWHTDKDKKVQPMDRRA